MLEAMAMARPVVATPAACEGLSVVAGQDVLVAETPAEFVDAVSAVLSGAADGLGAAARARAERDYDWCGNLQVLDGLFPDVRQTPAKGGEEYPVDAAALEMRVAS
jgi:glycosyltransferase involved in cell wall biosynthesis